MREIDQLIDEALDAEERELLHRIGEEPGWFSQIFGIFGGRTGWMNLVLMFVQAIAFVAGVWAAWNFFQAGDPLAAMRWGLPAAVLLLMSAMIKLAMWPAVHTNRLLLELKRIELQLARSAKV